MDHVENTIHFHMLTISRHPAAVWAAPFIKNLLPQQRVLFFDLLSSNNPTMLYSIY
jgi:hypothetical protein